MKRGHYILIAGGIIFAAGIILTTAWALPLAEEIQRNTTILQGREVGSGESVTATIRIADTTRPLSIVASAGQEVEMSVRVQDPNGNQIFGTTFTEAMAEAADPTVPGTYELVITNQSPSSATVDVVFGHIPGVGERDIDTDVFSGVLAGIAVTIAGIMVLIGGVVITVLDRRR